MQPADYLAELRARVDAHFAAAQDREGTAMQCRAGCTQCCHARFGVFEIEADPIRRALAELAQTAPELRQRIRDQARDESCPHCALLVDGICAVYPVRPLICRSHGLPIVVDDGRGDAFVDHCPLNFQTSRPARASLMVLDNLNKPLSALAQIAHPHHERIALAELGS